MKTYNVKVQYTFEGTYQVKANSAEEAKQIVDRDCGLVMGQPIECNNDEDVVDWDFSMHPDSKIKKVSIQK